ncbi:SixA phosphatase family protein [Rhodoligotrophos defluvii]|uniref:SixA phosphatase family protein n=1 Tax=Rhodoligotrophos defluvii TaxID=2561934 RepID=UPI0010C98DF3|nr:histidine phosphatase family protein [Rhodoligotrophos defluvii]
MLRLMLLRHAKSSWADADLSDSERPLNGRGRKAAPAMGLYMADKDLVPELILCSPAVRARTTLALAARAFPREIETRFIDDLYDFGDGDAIIDVVKAVIGAPSPLLVVGHNPSLAGAALSLGRPNLSPVRSRVAAKYPTAALLVLDFAIGTWAALAPGTGEMVSFTTPRDLGV